MSKNAVKQEKQATLERVPSPTHKAAGTRYGTFTDWREGRSENSSGRHGHAVRDGR
jgi:hypothetical protein